MSIDNEGKVNLRGTDDGRGLPVKNTCQKLYSHPPAAIFSAIFAR